MAVHARSLAVIVDFTECTNLPVEALTTVQHDSGDTNSEVSSSDELIDLEVYQVMNEVFGDSENEQLMFIA